MEKEAKARIRINKYLEDAGWRFFDSPEGPANVRLESNVKITEQALNELGEDFEKTKTAMSIISFWTRRATPSSFWKLKAKKRTRWTERNRPAGMRKT